ncbi:MAG: DUF892 family protein [Terrimicrobiaceae bacterium]|nr:DUF892 family protein [Terrimicrobiaceae bacterium]
MMPSGRHWESLPELYAAELDELYALVLLQTDVLSRAGESVAAPDLAKLARSEAGESRQQLTRIEELFEALGRTPGVGTRESTTALCREALAATEATGADHLRDAAVIGALRRMKHCEMATCSALAAMARGLGNPAGVAALEDVCRRAGEMDAQLEELSGRVDSAAAHTKSDVSIF